MSPYYLVKLYLSGQFKSHKGNNLKAQDVIARRCEARTNQSRKMIRNGLLRPLHGPQ
ncbi:MAG: hypothetical protein LBH67_00030 [Rickettsia sp.]|nr:hypothetical protein [Rickettsia sp.]